MSQVGEANKKLRVVKYSKNRPFKVPLFYKHFQKLK